MPRIKIDEAAPAVKEFLRSLPVSPEGTELELDGRVICKIIPARQFSEAKKQTLIARGRELVRRAQERNKGIPAAVIEREVRKAVEEVRERKRNSQ